MHSPALRAAKALAGLATAAELALAAAPPSCAASIGEGSIVKPLLSEKLPNVPGKTLTVVEVDYRPGGFSAPHRHPASGFVFAYVLSGAIRSQVEGEPLRAYTGGSAGGSTASRWRSSWRPRALPRSASRGWLPISTTASVC